MLKEKERELSRFIEILRGHPRGLTIEEISHLLPLNRNATSKYLNRLLISGQVEMKTFGPAKVFFISKRVPISELFNLSSDLIMVLDHEMFVRHVNDRLLDVFFGPAFRPYRSPYRPYTFWRMYQPNLPAND